MSATEKLRDIGTLSRISSDVRHFGDQCNGHIYTILSRSDNLVSEGQSIYAKMESKRKQIEEKLKQAQQAYSSCMYRHKNDKDDRDPCASERRKVDHYSALLQEISSVCQQAQSSLIDMKRDKEGLTNVCHKLRSDIESGVSSATSALSNIQSKAEGYAYAQAPVSLISAVPTSAYRGGVSTTNSGSQTDNSNVTKQETPLLEIPEELSGDYSAVNSGKGALITDKNGQKVVRIRKDGDTAIISGFDSNGIADFSDIENILQQNKIGAVSCWVSAKELDFYRQTGFSVKETSEGGFIITKTI